MKQTPKQVPLHTLPYDALFWLPLSERKGKVTSAERSGTSVSVLLWPPATEIPDGDRETIGETRAVQYLTIAPMTMVIPLDS